MMATPTRCSLATLMVGICAVSFGVGAVPTPTPVAIQQPTGTITPVPVGGGLTGPSITKTKTPEPGGTPQGPPASLQECSNCRIYDCTGGAARHRNHFESQKIKGGKKKKTKGSSSRSSKDIPVGKYDADADVKYKDFEKWCKSGGNVVDYGATAPVIWAKDSNCNDLYHCPAFTPVLGMSKRCGISCAADISGASAAGLLVIILVIVGCVCCSVCIGAYLFIKAGKKAKEVLEGDEGSGGGYTEDANEGYDIETDYDMTGAGGETAGAEESQA